MESLLHRLSEIEADSPVPLLTRQSVKGERILLAKVRLERGCKVGLHAHESEQIAYILRGRVRWGLGTPGTAERREFEAGVGEVLILPSNLPHEVEALEDTDIIDMLSPPGPMGIDSQRDRAH